MTKNVLDSQSRGRAASGALAGRAESVRQALADELLNELTSWSPRERLGTFKTWQRCSLSLVHLNVITVLEAAGGPLAMRQIAEALDVSDASATGIIDRLERRGFVERRHAEDDRRVVHVQLTAAGSQIFREFGEMRRRRLAALLERLDEAELAGFLGGVRALRAAGRALATTDDAPAMGAAIANATSASPASPAPDPSRPDGGGLLAGSSHAGAHGHATT